MTSPVLVFANPLSGGGLGQSVIDNLSGEEGIHIVKLPEDVENWKNLGDEILRNAELKVVVAGGDGSVNWVVSIMKEYYGIEKSAFRPPVAVVPLGTGNDLANMLGWGSSFGMGDMNRLKRIMQKVRRSNNKKDLDVWNVSYQRTDNNEEMKTKAMINYFSVGVDANIAQDFQKCRTDFPNLFCSHCLSKCMYVPVTFGSLIGQDYLKDYLSVESTNTDDSKEEVKFPSLAKTFVCQNITKIYGGGDLWRCDKPRSISDGKIEVCTQGGMWALAVDQIGIHFGKEITQSKKVEILSSQPCAFQVDGEATIINGPCKFVVEKTGEYPVLFS